MDEIKKPSEALIPFNENIIVKKKTLTEIMKQRAKDEDDVALAAVLDRITLLEAVNKQIKNVVFAARDVERNYLVPGKQRFERMVKLRKTLDELEAKMRG